ncbi:hypothetical protein UFOVP1528_21 [uncultured Caudovirales phage]|uniref:Uncharacterized protein n=1 Tax=uncultured Caudovirales phage TaxID=2100421 RepID=A0A6J5QHP0_9CAUD|nr:hypothetical protein UFOVP905_6 [uncultured Caudovirales phage]CAB4183192.1 hypothetical protein UFOVP1080_42 [uncultured Caudovirales phage]CAB4197595.1 hypothetical protein UFOVP1321_30 [uncultured Caudovirales phage]CAB4212700.1 hypothetical protein UFOVP1432_33 [uncultured Caudovirales phage]CAB5227269.1 hypothetical protein UFOVP1528_21 [uncultured Caudovirales phage]
MYVIHSPRLDTYLTFTGLVLGMSYKIDKAKQFKTKGEARTFLTSSLTNAAPLFEVKRLAANSREDTQCLTAEVPLST